MLLNGFLHMKCVIIDICLSGPWLGVLFVSMEFHLGAILKWPAHVNNVETSKAGRISISSFRLDYFSVCVSYSDYAR